MPKRFETLDSPKNDEQVYNLMFLAFQAGISVGTVPKTDEKLFDEWINEEINHG